MAKRAGPRGADDQSVSLAEAAALLGVGQGVLVEALVEHGLTEAEAKGARLLMAELDKFRGQLQGDSERVQAELSALREVLEGD